MSNRIQAGEEAGYVMPAAQSSDIHWWFKTIDRQIMTLIKSQGLARWIEAHPKTAERLSSQVRFPSKVMGRS